MADKTELVNNVSQPPLTTPFLDANGLVSRAWAIWFRDIYKRTSFKGGNAIDDLALIVDGEIDTLEEVILVVNDHEVRITANKDQIDVNVQDISDNKTAIEENEQEILNLENRTFGSSKPSDYQETGVSYAKYAYVFYNGFYYQAINAIAAPAGPFDSSLWAKASIQDTRAQALATFVEAGYGGIGLNAAAAIGTINTTFQTLTGWDATLVDTPKDVTQDISNDGIRLQRLGVWQFDVKISIEFDEVNAGRRIKLRSYNATKATAGTEEFVFFVGRNQGGINMPVTINVDIDGTATEINDLIQLQVAADTGSADFTTSSNIGSILQVIHVSERQEALSE